MYSRLSTIPVLGCSDGVVVQDSISYSFTPYLGQWLNLHPSHRHSYSGLLKFGLFPQGMATYNGLFNSVFDLARQPTRASGWSAGTCVRYATLCFFNYFFLFCFCF